MTPPTLQNLDLVFQTVRKAIAEAIEAGRRVEVTLSRDEHPNPIQAHDAEVNSFVLGKELKLYVSVETQEGETIGDR